MTPRIPVSRWVIALDAFEFTTKVLAWVAAFNAMVLLAYFQI